MQSRGDYSFAGENSVFDLGQNMNSSNMPYVYSTGTDTINITPLTASDLTWIGNITIEGLQSVTIK
jgi:hypothetical protein